MKISAGIIVRDESGPKPVYLCVRAYSNWDFPKGHVENGETLLEAAIRETIEETTLGSSDIKLLGMMAPPVLYKSGKKTAHYFLADRISKKQPFLPVNPELGKPENDEFQWFTIEQMKNVMPGRLLPVVNWIQSTS